MPDKTKQDQYLSGLVITYDPTWVGTQGKGGRFSEANKGKKKTTFKYYVPTSKFFGIFALITADKCRLRAIFLPAQGHVVGLCGELGLTTRASYFYQHVLFRVFLFVIPFEWKERLLVVNSNVTTLTFAHKMFHSILPSPHQIITYNCRQKPSPFLLQRSSF